MKKNKRIHHKELEKNKPSLAGSKVRPLTSHGRSQVGGLSSAEKQQVTNERPKTAAAQLRRKKISSSSANESLNDEKIGNSTIFHERRLSSAGPERDRSSSVCSVSTDLLTPRQKSRRKSQTIATTVLDLKQSRSVVRSSKKNSLSSHGNIIHRKVAWQPDREGVHLPTFEISDCSGKDTVNKCNELHHEKQMDNDKAIDITAEDMYKAPDLSVMDSGDEYETELEDNSPVVTKQFDFSGKTTYQRLCKKQDVLAASGLSNEFTNNEMRVRHRGLGWKGALPLAKSLAKNTFVEKLDLTDNYIEGIGASLVADMFIDNCYITELNLSQNFIRADGGIALARMLTKNHILQKVVLRANHFTDRVAKELGETLRENRTLSHLDIGHNEIGEKGAVNLGAGLALNYGLKHLDLSWNCIRGKGGVALAQALKTNDSLTSLNLSWNGISLLGCVALGKFLRKNENLKELDLRNNRIGYLGAQRITPAVSKNTSLETLKVGLNPLSDEGVEALLKAIKMNKSLKLLSLEDVTVSETVYKDIQQLEKIRQIKIITGGLGGYKKPKQMPRQMAILLDFIKVNRLRLVDWFFQFDKDQSGDISRDEFKNGLKEIGLKMTQRQLDTLIEYLDVDNNGKIEYSELLIGRDHTLKEQRDFRMGQQKIKNVEDMRARLPTIPGFEPN